jgi:hypothetical protein
MRKTMRGTVLVALIAALSLQVAAAREIRRETMPEAFWGTWSPNGDACKDGDTSAIALSAKAYAGPSGNCAIDYVTEIPGRDGAIYSARMSCAGSDAPAQKKAIANLIIRADNAEQISVGPSFEGLVVHRRCPAATAPGKQK